jgi:hypothetical protein
MRPHRKKVYGRQVAPATFGASAYDTPFAPRKFHSLPDMTTILNRKRYKQRDPGDPPIAPGYKLSKKHQKVPLDHQSYKPMQDFIEHRRRKRIKSMPAGKDRDYLIEELEEWIANGRPTYGQPGRNAKKNDWVKTNKESTAWMDEVEDMDPKHRKRMDLRDIYPELEG